MNEKPDSYISISLSQFLTRISAAYWHGVRSERELLKTEQIAQSHDAWLQKGRDWFNSVGAGYFINKDEEKKE